MYRFTPCILVLLGLILPQFIGAMGLTFPDVAGGVYEPAFSYLSSIDVVQGYNDGTGKPHKGLNRAEGAKVTMSLVNPSRVAWFVNHLPPVPIFPDQDLYAWYTPPIEAAFEAGIVKGHDDGYLRPGQVLTVEQAITMLVRAYGLSPNSSSALLSPNIQNRDGQWFTPHINVAIERNLVMAGSNLQLGRQITRGQFFDIAYRLDYIHKNNALVFDDGTGGGFDQIANIPSALGLPDVNIPVVSSHPYASEKYFAISLPTLGINDLTVSDPYDPNDLLGPLQNGVGHLFGYPGSQGKVMIYGHSSDYPWRVSDYSEIFRQINQLQTGDRFYITYDGKVHTYEVTHQQTIAAADMTPFMDDGTGEEVMLYTCWPPNSTHQRLVVHALPVEVVALQ